MVEIFITPKKKFSFPDEFLADIQDISSAHFSFLLDFLIANKEEACILTGNEPFLHPQLEELLITAQRKGVFIVLETGSLPDEDVMKVIKRQVKQRKDSIEQYKNADRDDLVKDETEELKHLETYLPPELGRDEIKKIVLKKKEELGVEDKSKMGILIGAVMKEVGGNADGAVVKELVEEALS